MAAAWDAAALTAQFTTAAVAIPLAPCGRMLAEAEVPEQVDKDLPSTIRNWSEVSFGAARHMASRMRASSGAAKEVPLHARPGSVGTASDCA